MSEERPDRPDADRNPARSASGRIAGFVAALLSGGDSRLAVDPLTGVNKYLCPPTPARDLVCASSCTASPISSGGFARARGCYDVIMDSSSALDRARRIETFRAEIEAGLGSYFGAAQLAAVMLCPSGTDAVLSAARLVAAERDDRPVTAILPAASETGTGVPLAATGRAFDGPAAPTSPHARTKVVEIPLRAADGEPLSQDEVNDGFRAAAKAARGRPVIYLTHGSKTGLVAPVEPPDGVDVIVDACQARIEPRAVAAYLRRGWPVVVTGSKFFGGPAFSGAVLFPKHRMPRRRERLASEDGQATPTLGTVLRWMAALEGIEAFTPLAGAMAGFLHGRRNELVRGLTGIPGVRIMRDHQSPGPSWADQPSIVTVAIRDPSEPDRLLSVAELRPLYRSIAQCGVLIGQPVALGPGGGLRIAFGARDIIEPDTDLLPRLIGVLRDVLARQ